jgi:3-hydroxybutyryl-CoA dehydrogenase
MREELIAVIGDSGQWEDLNTRKLPIGWVFVYAANVVELEGIDGPRVIFILQQQALRGFPFDDFRSDTLFFVHAMTKSCDELHHHQGIIRINAWPGFLKNELLEIAAPDERKPAAEAFLKSMDWEWEWVGDVAGMATPRVISMIINEACFAVGEDVSTPDGIDQAMKLGAAYPIGPFEWCRRIGKERIIGLLELLSEGDERYRPAPHIDKILISLP